MAIKIPVGEWRAHYTPLGAIEHALRRVAENTGAGAWDGHHADNRSRVVTMFLRGPDVDRLFAAVEGVLKAFALPPRSLAIKRYGPAGSREAQVLLR
ncbi:hypothetical protein Misp01_21150 [Microtetraspora sp. NBRC 13810]|uniref:hypothetical protein n=1 Tax=Microtetraspora sp. NBRC 13810 TaxID=3030990 RepID=UPI0024A1AC57|nr:hypothetical protein [Microtetraspora sp. NBRC 13810]GLW06985.1 hypothetical protein Misp01_21150 [Microtetraspora sp. NBRC 13810]